MLKCLQKKRIFNLKAIKLQNDWNQKCNDHKQAKKKKLNIIKNNCFFPHKLMVFNAPCSNYSECVCSTLNK